MPYVSASPRFRRLLLNAVFVPLVLMLVITGALIWQISYLLHDSARVEHADAIISRTNELQRMTIDLETGLRGFLITGDDRFLDPYNQALAQVDEKGEALIGIFDEPQERQEMREINDARNKWLKYSREQIQIRRQHGDLLSIVMSMSGKQQMDSMRQMFARLIDYQSQIRNVRFRDAERASEITLVLVGGFGLGGGLLLAFLSRQQFLSLTSTFDAAMKTAQDVNQSLEQRVAERTGDLEQRSIQLEEVNRELEAFSYSISHDLRAPMRHITGFATLLEKSETVHLSSDDRENLTTIQQTAKLAGQMVDDLLAFSRVGRTPLRSVEVDLNALLVECRHELSPDTNHRRIDWKIDPLPVASGDPAMFKLVLNNLLANAIKYTSKRDVAVIEVGCIDTARANAPEKVLNQTAGNQVICFVKDNGVGFNMNYSDKLFGVFQRLHRAEDFEGTGIGLANVKRIVGRMGGSVWATGELAKGATFFFSVPLFKTGDS